jgi:hypothetical protein
LRLSFPWFSTSDECLHWKMINMRMLGCLYLLRLRANIRNGVDRARSKVLFLFYFFDLSSVTRVELYRLLIWWPFGIINRRRKIVRWLFLVIWYRLIDIV